LPSERRVLGWMDVTGLGMGARGKWARGTMVGGFVFLSGQTAFDENDRLMGVGDPRAQARNALNNIRLLLLRAGAQMSDVVKLFVYVTDRAYRPVVYDEIVKAFGGRCPSSTGLIVSGLAKEELLVEIDAIAAIGSSRRHPRRRVSSSSSATAK